MKKLPTPLDDIKDHGYCPSSSYKPDLTRETRFMSIYKTISWRVLATTDTFIIAWFITGTFAWAATIASVEVFTKMGLYYLHERGWSKITL